MPSPAKVIKKEQDGDEWKVIIKVRGVGVKNLNSPVATRARFRAASEVGVLADYVPNTLSEWNEVDVSELTVDGYVAETEKTNVLDDDILQQTALYGIRVHKPF